MNLFSWFRKRMEEKEKEREDHLKKNEDIRQLDYLIEDLFQLDDKRYSKEEKAV